MVRPGHGLTEIVVLSLVGHLLLSHRSRRLSLIHRRLLALSDWLRLRLISVVLGVKVLELRLIKLDHSLLGHRSSFCWCWSESDLFLIHLLELSVLEPAWSCSLSLLQNRSGSIGTWSFSPEAASKVWQLSWTKRPLFLLSPDSLLHIAS